MNYSVREIFTSLSKSFSRTRLHQTTVTLSDQILSVGGTFLVNVVFARTQSKAEYGAFALCYSLFIFFLSIHNALILETFTVYGSGRYQRYFASYERYMWRANIGLGLGMTVGLTCLWFALAWAVPALASSTTLGMAVTCGVLVTASFIRRTFYLRRRPDLAAKFSATFFFSCALLLWCSVHYHILNGFYAFLIIALSWTAAGILMIKELPVYGPVPNFLEIEPDYPSAHWKYARWVLITAFVFQLTTQGYYWLAAGLLSVKEVGNLRSMSNLVIPIDQVFTALDLLILPIMCSGYALQKAAGLTRIWKAYSAVWFLVTLAFAIFLNCFSKPIMHRLYGGRFDDVAPLVSLLAFLPVIMGIGHTMNGALKAAERPELVFYAYAFSGAATFLLGTSLVVRYGLLGSVVGMLISGATYTTVLGFGLWTVLNSKPQHVVPISSLE